MRTLLYLFTLFTFLLPTQFANGQNDVHVDGNLGINIANPSFPLHLHRPTPGISYMRISDNTSGSNSGLRIGTNGTGSAYILNDYAPGFLYLGTNGGVDVTLNSAGNLGIGTSSIFTKLTMNGTIGFLNAVPNMMYIYQSGSTNDDKGIFVHSPNFQQWGLFYDDNIDNLYTKGGGSSNSVWIDMFQGNLGVEYSDPYNDVILAGTDSTNMPVMRIGHTGGFNEANSGAIIFEENIGNYSSDQHDFCGVAMRLNGSSNDLEFIGGCTANFGTGSLIMAMDRNGSVGINTTPNSVYSLQVAGKVRAEEVLVETGWADYVFEKDYNLLSLHQVEEFIEQNKHLPGVPAGSVIESEGVALGAMSEVFIRKIEELTLYTIDQGKQIDQLSVEKHRLQSTNTRLSEQVRSQQQELEDLSELTEALLKRVEALEGNGSH